MICEHFDAKPQQIKILEIFFIVVSGRVDLALQHHVIAISGSLLNPKL